jgi:hypothetical protein
VEIPFSIVRGTKKQAEHLRPAGYNAFAETIKDWLIPIGTTAIVIIGCYALAYEEIGQLIDGHNMLVNMFVLLLVASLGALIDITIVVSAARLKMHILRGKQERGWAIITGSALAICIFVEATTLIYFGYLVAPSMVPEYITQNIQSIHSTLYVVRYTLPPLLLAYIGTCLMPITIEPSDLDRIICADVSLNIAGLVQKLTRVGITQEERLQLLPILPQQLAFYEHASHADKTQVDHNIELVQRLSGEAKDERALLQAQIDRLQGDLLMAKDNVTTLESALADAQKQIESVNRLKQQVKSLQAELKLAQTPIVAPPPPPSALRYPTGSEKPISMEFVPSHTSSPISASTPIGMTFDDEKVA